MYHDLLNTKSLANQLNKSCACETHQPADTKSDTVECRSESDDRENVEFLSRDNGKQRIEKLVTEIHELMTFDLKLRKVDSTTELHDDNSNHPKPGDLSESSEQEYSYYGYDKLLKNTGDKPLLDIQELKTVAAMAKRLNASSKKSNIT